MFHEPRADPDVTPDNNGKHAHELSGLQHAIEQIKTEIGEWAQQNDVTARIEDVYVNGSMGAGAGGEGSDVDITVAVSFPECGADRQQDYALRMGDVVGNRVQTVDDWWPVDVTVVPKGDSLVESHLLRKSEHGGYSWIFNVNCWQYMEVDTI